MALKGAEVIERVDLVEPASMDEAHEEIPHARSVFGFVTCAFGERAEAVVGGPPR